jgi:hypothetical protein
LESTEEFVDNGGRLVRPLEEEEVTSLRDEIERGAGNTCGDPLTRLYWNEAIFRTVDDKRRAGDPGKKIA